jgi:hypothetical protein
MDEQKNDVEAQKCKGTCACAVGRRCGCGCDHGRGLIWWVVGIFILVIVFAMGVKVGEFRDELRSSYGGYYRGYPTPETRVYNGGGVAVPMQAGSATGAPGESVSTGTTPIGQ